MRLFSRKRKPDSFSLTTSSFKTTSEIIKGSVKVSPPGTPPEEEVWEASETSFTRSEVEISLFNQTVGIGFDPTELEMPEKVYIERLNEKLNWIAANKTIIEEAICQDLLETKNEYWLEEGEKDISEKTFITRLTIEEINFFSDSSAELYFNDGDLFWGHSIVIDLSAENQLDNVKTAG